jgi:sugar phosphate permease
MTASPALFYKITRRLMPVLFASYILAYIDRVNVGFAKLAMKQEPWFSDAVFATGAGIFFVGYFLFEVPGNVILHRVGARRWIARIMVTWGLVSAALAFSSSAASFYFLRFCSAWRRQAFFLEGLPAVLLGLALPWLLTDRAAEATWLKAE